MLLRHALLLGLGLAGTVVALAAQDPPPPVIVPKMPPRPGGTTIIGPSQGPPVFRGLVDLIQVDASVLDKDRRPVHGLTAKDFTVFEDGKEQPIVAITEMNASDPEWGPDTWMRSVVPDVKVNNAEDGRVLLLLLNDAITPDPMAPLGGKAVGPKPAEAVKQVARAIVERLGPADLAAVIFTSKNKDEQEFTSDRTKLLAAVDGYDPGRIEPYGRVEDTYKDAAKFLAEIPNRRKAIILISPRMPSAILPGSPAIINRMAGFLQDAFTEALRGNVTFYGINPMMLNGLDAEVDKLLDPEPSASDRPGATFARPTGGPPPVPKYEADVRPWPLDQLTGGFSIRRTQDFADGITQIFRETGSYYLLGYSNPNPKDDGKLRHIEVRMNRPGLTVRSRTGYLAPTAKAARNPGTPNWKAIGGLLPVKDIPMRINVATFAIPGKKEVALTVALGLREPLPIGLTTPVNETVTFLTQAFTNEGDRRGAGQTQRADLTLMPNPRGEAKYEVLSLLTLKPGKYHIRFSAWSRLQNRSGSIYYDVEIPDYSKAPLSLSGVAVSATPSVTSAPKTTFEKLIPVVPTTQREFAGHRGSTFLRVYEGGKKALEPVQMTVRIIDTRDAEVFTKTDTIPATQFGAKTRAADYRFELPIKDLGPGTYLLTFTATTTGAPPARQDVRFTVSDPSVGVGPRRSFYELRKKTSEVTPST